MPNMVGGMAYYKLALVHAVSGDVREVVECVIDLGDLPSRAVVGVGHCPSSRLASA